MTDDADVDYIELYGATSAVQKVTNLNATAPSNATIKNTSDEDISIQGQINTPITSSGNYIFFGTFSGTQGGKYYQCNTSTKVLTEWDPNYSNFYWAGAYTDGNNIVFGSDRHIPCYFPQMHKKCSMRMLLGEESRRKSRDRERKCHNGHRD